MEKIKEAVGVQLEETETAIVDMLLNSKKVQMYIVTLNSLRDFRNDFLEQVHQGEVQKETRRKFITLKKGKEMLEQFPEVKAYLAMFSRHAHLVDSYRLLASSEISPSR